MSKKLEGNGLWESSRMMLPEHRAALNQRRAEPVLTKPELPTQDEFRMIRESVILPMMLSIVERNYKKLETTDLSLRKLYITATQVLMDRIHADLSKVKKELRERKIRVHEEEMIDSTARYKVFCRGYEDSFTIMRDLVKAEIGVQLSNYISSVFHRTGEGS